MPFSESSSKYLHMNTLKFTEMSTGTPQMYLYLWFRIKNSLFLLDIVVMRRRIEAGTIHVVAYYTRMVKLIMFVHSVSCVRANRQ